MLAYYNSALTMGYDFMAGFGKWVEAMRERRGMSQRALARQSKISSASVSKIEDGLMNPTPDMLMKLATGMVLPPRVVVEAWINGLVESGEITYDRTADFMQLPDMEGFNELDTKSQSIIRQRSEAAALKAFIDTYTTYIEAMRIGRESTSAVGGSSSGGRKHKSEGRARVVDLAALVEKAEEAEDES